MLKFNILRTVAATLRVVFETLFAILFLILMKWFCKVWNIWRCKNEIFSFWNVFHSSSPSLTFGWIVIWIEDLLIRIQCRKRIETPINIWLMFSIKGNNSNISSNWKFFLNDEKQNFFFRRIETFKIFNLIHFWTILKLVLNSN